MATRVVALVALLVVLGRADSVLAQFILNRGGSTTGSTCTGGGSPEGDCRFFRHQVGADGSYTSRYAWNINADAAAAGVHDTSGTAVHNVTFTVTAPGGYRLLINSKREGSLSRVADDAGCNGAADTSGVVGTSDVPLSWGTLDLPDPDAIPSGGGNATLDIDQFAGGYLYGVSNGVPQPHSLSFTWSGSVHSQSCEVAVRQGETSGTTVGCPSCNYTGSGILSPEYGHFVEVVATSLCGNGQIDPEVGEECDDHSLNGTSGSCCTSTCHLKTLGTVCRAAAGVCDAQETCDGVSGACPANALKPSTTECRAAAGTCDIAENCTGSSINCPTNQFVASGTVCRPAAGVCDVEETCNGTAACPADGVAANSVVCRPAAGTCDVAENCVGTTGSNDCPADAFVSASVVCRAAAGECDAAEQCPGSAAACPADAKQPNGTACTDDGAGCTSDTCDGSGDACQHPLKGAGVVCRAAAGVCDVAETCDGVGSACPADALVSSATVCRPSGGVCDPSESCTGSDAACPADAKSTSLCRASVGSCDVAESCDGVGDACPPDQVQPASTVCRPAGGVCDVAESCDGSSGVCPADAKSTAGCRAVADACDVAESCDGVGDACPADAFAPSSVVCRPDAGQCDVAESCTGSGPACPTDAFEPDGTGCDDGQSCTSNDVCTGGVCGGDSAVCGNGVIEGGCAEECDDGNTNANDGCSPTCQIEMGLACRPAPESGCKPPFVSGKAQLRILDRSPDTGDQLSWRWLTGSLTTVTEFGDPRATTSYQLCVYDQGGKVLGASIPAGGVCRGRFCWATIGSTGFKYNNKDATPAGVTQLSLQQGVDGKAKIKLKAKGDPLETPILLDLEQPVRVQLTNTAGKCWEAVYSAPAQRQTQDQFKDRGD